MSQQVQAPMDGAHRNSTSALQSRPRESASLATFPLFPVATHKFIVLSLVSFSAYTFYWFYQSWKRINTASPETLSPFGGRPSHRYGDFLFLVTSEGWR